MAAAALAPDKLGAFLRREGVREAELEQWRAAVLEAGQTALESGIARPSARSGESKRIKELERELRRKDKALAEAAALLVLQENSIRTWRKGTKTPTRRTRSDPRAALDAWMRRDLRSVRLCRYADDGVVHCRSQERRSLHCGKSERGIQQCGLELHPEKTRIAYCQDVNRHLADSAIRFTFLGYTFRSRRTVDKYGRLYVNFSPGVSRDALRAMRQTIRGWHLQLKCDKSLMDLSNMFNPVLRGWANYYGRFHRSALQLLWRHVNDYLVRWLQRKYKHLARISADPIRSLDDSLQRLQSPSFIGNAGDFRAARRWEPDESRDSRPVLRGAGAEMPWPTHPYLLSSVRGRFFYLYLVRNILIRFVTPDERHYSRENGVLANRVRVYERARRRNPDRWSRRIRNWSPAPAFPNPKRDQETIEGARSRETDS